MLDDTVSDSKIHRAAQNAWLQVLGRLGMVFIGGLGMPVMIILGTNIADSLAGLRVGVSKLELRITETKGEVQNLKTLQEYQLRSFDERLGAQSRRMDSFDMRFDRLESPFFNGRHRPSSTTP
jgi:hypothetical protein